MQTRSRRLSRPMLRTAKASGFGVNVSGDRFSPIRWGVFTGSAAGIVYGGITAGTTVNSSTVVYTQWDWISEPLTLTPVVTIATGTTPAVYYKIGLGVSQIAFTIPIMPRDILRLGIASGDGLAASGTVSFLNRPDLGSFTYSVT